MRTPSYYGKLAIALAASIIFSGIVTTIVFPYHTPEIRPHIGSYLVETAGGLLGGITVRTGAFLASIRLPTMPEVPVFPRVTLPDTIRTTDTSTPLRGDTPSAATAAKSRLASIPQSTVSQGVYLQSDSVAVIYTVRQTELGWGSKAYTVNGQTIEVLYAAGETPPSSEFVELCTR